MSDCSTCGGTGTVHVRQGDDSWDHFDCPVCVDVMTERAAILAVITADERARIRARMGS